MDRIGCVAFSHFHIIVDDLDQASEFYREVMDFVEMQSHHNLVNRGLSEYYGVGADYENFVVSLRFLAWPGVLTLKLLKIDYKGYQGTAPSARSGNPGYANKGLGPISVRLKELDSTYRHLLSYARDYSAKFKIQLLSPPVFLSPLLPHQIGATEHSALHRQDEILNQLADEFPNREKFQMIDPFDVRWEFNNDVF